MWLRSRPEGNPQAADFGLREVVLPALDDGTFLVQNQFLSADPAMRGWITDSNNYLPRVQIGDTMRALAAGVVIESRHAAYAVGDPVMGWFGWQEFAAVTPAQVWRRVGERHLPLSLSLGVLGINGLTAYFGLLDVLQPQAGETVVVSTAAGSVGSAVGQVARIRGCRTIGIAGRSDKVHQCIDEFGYDAAIDYKNIEDLDAVLATHCPDGVDGFFDNTSGIIHDAVPRRINLHARIAICGTVSYPSREFWNVGPRPERHLLVERATMRGFLIADYVKRYDEAIGALTTARISVSNDKLLCDVHLWGPSAGCAEGLDVAHSASGSPSGLTRLFGWLAVSWCVAAAAVGSPAAAVAVAQPGSCPDTQIVFACGTNEALPAFGGQRKVKL